MPGPKARSLVERFWEKVDRAGGPDACWPWMAAVHRNGYGKFGITRRQTALAHRMAFELTNGPIPPGHYVCHRCDNPPCCNPAHLFAALPVGNVADMESKGRRNLNPRRPASDSHWTRRERHRLLGSGNPNAKLTAAQVIEIRRRWAAGGVRYQDLAAEFDVNPSTIGGIVTGRSWPPGATLTAAAT